MKKVKSLLITTIIAVCAAIACFAFAACSEDTGLEGTYKVSYMTMTLDGTTTTVKAGESYMGMTINSDYVVLEIKDDGNFSMTGMGQTQEGTWKEEDGVVKLTVDGETLDATRSGKTLTMNIEEYITVVLTK